MEKETVFSKPRAVVVHKIDWVQRIHALVLGTSTPDGLVAKKQRFYPDQYTEDIILLINSFVIDSYSPSETSGIIILSQSGRRRQQIRDFIGELWDKPPEEVKPIIDWLKVATSAQIEWK